MPDSRTPLPQVALESTAMLHVLGSEAPSPLPPLPASTPAVVALSEDHPLLQSLTQAVIQRLAVVTCPSADRFVDQLVANVGEIALIDAAIAPKPLDVFLLALHRQFPQLQLVVVGAAAQQAELAAQISDGTIFRFAPKPASAERLKSLLFAALRHRELLDGASAAIDPSRASPPGSQRARRWRWALLLMLTAAAAAVGGWFASAYAGRHLLP
jgi:DNA-binding NarL/FixJ family response regulator